MHKTFLVCCSDLREKFRRQQADNIFERSRPKSIEEQLRQMADALARLEGKVSSIQERMEHHGNQAQVIQQIPAAPQDTRNNWSQDENTVLSPGCHTRPWARIQQPQSGQEQDRHATQQAPATSIERQPTRPARPPGQGHFPLLKSMRSLVEFWKLWEEGSGKDHSFPLKLYQERQNRPSRFNRQRFNELAKVAKHIETQAVQQGKPPKQVAKDMDKDRTDQKATVPGFTRQIIRSR